MPEGDTGWGRAMPERRLECMVFGMWLGRDAICNGLPFLESLKLFVWLEVLMAIIADWPSCVMAFGQVSTTPGTLNSHFDNNVIFRECFNCLSVS